MKKVHIFKQANEGNNPPIDEFVKNGLKRSEKPETFPTSSKVLQNMCFFSQCLTGEPKQLKAILQQ